MPVNRLTSNFLQRTDVLDNITPKVWKQESIDAPAGPWYPAEWLPIQFSKTNRDAGTDQFVISSGKVVAFDAQGFVVPAGLRTALQAGAAALTYTSDDKTWGVIDLVTGKTVAGAVSYSTLQVALAILERGLILEQEAQDAGATVPPTTNTEANAIIDLFINHAIGVTMYDVNVWSGLAENGDMRFTNYSKQHAIQIITEHQMQVPHFVASSESATSFDFAALNTAGSATATAGAQVDAGEYWDATNLSALTRYEAEVSTSSKVVALGMNPGGAGVQYRLAKNTARTPFTSNVSGILVRERTSISSIAKEGDWYLDADLGVLFLHSDTWATQVAAAATPVFSYYYYSQAPASAHRHVHFDDVGKPGDYLTFDAQSNFRVATAAEVAAGVDIVGRLLKIETQPRTLLDKVKTAWTFDGIDKTGQMPGTATQGYTDLITLSNETVADQVVVLNLRVL